MTLKIIDETRFHALKKKNCKKIQTNKENQEIRQSKITNYTREYSHT